MDGIPGWTILAYLDGNGELEPEIAAAYYELEAAAADGQTRVLLEAGRLEQSTVQIIRPGTRPEQEIWDGVRRHELNAGEKVLTQDLGRINMADPKSLYDFLLWGLKNTDTDHVMLVLGGHACEYIGLMNDYSGKYPVIMGIPELAATLEMAANAVGRVIDLLVIDACYCNNIETLYELGYRENSAVKTLITYREYAGAKGISFRKLLKTAGKSGTASPAELADRICSEVSSDLVARAVQSENLGQLKRLFDSLGRKALCSKTRSTAGPSGLLTKEAGENKYEWDEANEIFRIVSDLTIGQETKARYPGREIGILEQYLPNKGLAALYYRLAFARDNAWTQLLCSQLNEKQYTFLIAIGFSPLLISEGKVRALIESCNPWADAFTVDTILKGLIEKREWDKRLFPNLYQKIAENISLLSKSF